MTHKQRQKRDGARACKWPIEADPCTNRKHDAMRSQKEARNKQRENQERRGQHEQQCREIQAVYSVLLLRWAARDLMFHESSAKKMAPLQVPYIYSSPRCASETVF